MLNLNILIDFGSSLSHFAPLNSYPDKQRTCFTGLSARGRKIREINFKEKSGPLEFLRNGN